jgi:hypothetical protein
MRIYRTECNTGIIAACLPCLKPLFRRIFETSWNYGSTGKSKKETNNHTLNTFHRSGIHGADFQNPSTVRSTKRTSANRDLEDNYSEESILPLQGNTITKTTVITVDRSVTSTLGGEQWSKKQEFAPERRIEDRV